jgi:nitronate monooxygenase
MQTGITRLLGCDLPIIQAPMAGGGDTPELVAAVGNAGAFGFVGAAYLDAEQILATARSVRTLTPRPFGINLFAPTAPPRDANIDAVIERLLPYYAQLGLPPPSRPTAPSTNAFTEQAVAAIESDASVLSFTFGLLPADSFASTKARGVKLIGTATTVAEAIALEQSGVDAIVVQGSEAGGHRGTFLGDFAAAQVGTIALVPQVVDSVTVGDRLRRHHHGRPRRRRGARARCRRGATGTAFTCAEAGVAEAHKDAPRETDRCVTRFFRAARARYVNRFMTEIDQAGDAIAPFPIQNALTRALRSVAAKQGHAEFLSLWAGQGVRMARRQTVAELVARLHAETRAAIRRLSV